MSSEERFNGVAVAAAAASGVPVRWLCGVIDVLLSKSIKLLLEHGVVGAGIEFDWESSP